MNIPALIIKRSILIVAFVATFSLTPVIGWGVSVPPSQEKIPPGAGATVKSSDDEIVERLKRATQELLDAIAPGDKGVWQRYLAEGSIYADEEGRVLTKDELIKELNPLPPGYVGSIKKGLREGCAGQGC